MSWHSGFQIKVVEGPECPRVTPLVHARLTIGRSRVEGGNAEGWLLLYDKSVSREHAELSWDEENGTYRLRHLSKTNLTWVDGVSVTQDLTLRPGQVIKVGASLLEFGISEESKVSGEVGVSPLASGGELTERISVGAIALSLKREESLPITVIEGADQGKSLELTGLNVALGRDSKTSILWPGEKSERKFDQTIELTDPELLPNHLALRWDDLNKAYRVWKRPDGGDAAVKRTSDGFIWTAMISEEGGLLRPGDTLAVGGTMLGVGISQSASAEPAVKSLPLG